MTAAALGKWAGAALVLSACSGVPTAMATARGEGARPDVATLEQGGRVQSNILRADYAGSSACAPCHEDVYAAWSGSPMHRMTRAAAVADVRAPFDGRVIHFKNDSVTLVQEARDRFFVVSSSEFGNHTYRVTRVIGGRHREDFAGIEVTDARGGARCIGSPNEELVLPMSYVYSPPSFRVKGYSVMVSQRPGLRAGGIWNRTCIFCHNTAPYLSSLFGALLGPSARAYQGAVVDRLLPSARRSALLVTNPADLARAAEDEIRFLEGGPHGGDGGGADNCNGGSGERRPGAVASDEEQALDAADNASDLGKNDGAGNRELSVLLDNAIGTTQHEFGAPELVELGIGCESCHGGSRAHTLDPEIKPTFEIQSSFLHAALSPWEATQGASPKVTAQNRVCARCHQVLFSRYPFTWEGGRRSGHAGGSHMNSGEARDFFLGACTSALTCVTCHDPHAADSADKLRALESPAGNQVCARCHVDKQGDDKLAAHAHHRPGSAGAVCINCHMPMKNVGLSYALTRYHRIGSPTDRARVEGDRPLECALCHADKTVEDLVATMERWWKKRYDRGRLSALYGDLGALPLVTTAQYGKGHEQATALYVLGANRTASAAQVVAGQMVNRYPLVRYYARQALASISGRPCDVNLDQDDAQIQADLARWLSASAAPPIRGAAPHP